MIQSLLVYSLLLGVMMLFFYQASYKRYANASLNSVQNNHY